MIETEKEKEQDIYRSKHVNLYIEDVIKPLLPNARVSGVSSFGHPDYLHYSARVEVQNTNEVLFGSRYYFPGNLEFIHYTNLQSLINILNDRAFRMYDFNYLNDPQEFVYSAEKIKLPSKHDDIKGLKENIFSLSMCIHDDTDNRDDFDMWRLYGQHGRGIGIILTFDDSNRKNWYEHYLSKVYYDDNDLSMLLDLQKRHEEFHQKYKFHVNDYQDIFYQLLGFHKRSIYKSENEVRLLKHVEKSNQWKDHNKGDIYYCVNARLKKSAYTRLELDCPERTDKFEKFRGIKDFDVDRAIKLFPVVKIKKVILGYEIDDKSAWDIAFSLDRISKRTLGYTFPIEISHLKEYFEVSDKK